MSRTSATEAIVAIAVNVTRPSQTNGLDVQITEATARTWPPSRPRS